MRRRRLAKREMRQVKADQKAIKRAVRAHQRREEGERGQARPNHLAP